MDGDQRLSYLRVIDLPLRVDSAVVSCGGIGGVGTPREHRNNGYARCVLDDSMAFMREAGYHLSALFGIEGFYSRWGFGPAIVDCEGQIMTRYAERAEARMPARAFRPGDAPAVAVIYEQSHTHHTGSVVRDPATWAGFRFGTRWSDRVDTFVVLQDEEVVGYACYDLDPHRASLAEVGASTPLAYSTIVAEAARIAWERRLAYITVHTAPDDPFLKYCRRYGVEVKVVYPCQENGLARVINQTGLLETLRPVLARRLAAYGWEGTLQVTTDLGTDRLSFGNGRQEVAVEFPQWILAQLVLGYRSVDDAAFETGARIPERALPVLRILFPEGYPCVNWPDRF